MNEFKSYHPLVNFLYFFSAILFTCAHLNPISVFISFFSSFVFFGIVKGREEICKIAVKIPFLFILMALINPAFNHQGVTVLAYLPSGNPLTYESVCFGFIAAGMVLSVMLYFSCFNEIMTSDKIVYIFGRIIPSLALVFSMTLRIVPKFKNQIFAVAKAQKCIGRDVTGGAFAKRIKSGISILSIMITWSMENAIETADSMKARGFGTARRTAFSIFQITKRDKYALFVIFLLSLYIICGSILGAFSFSCFPYIKMAEMSAFSVSFYIAELTLMSVPAIIEISEQRKWKYIG